MRALLYVSGAGHLLTDKLLHLFLFTSIGMIYIGLPLPDVDWVVWVGPGPELQASHELLKVQRPYTRDLVWSTKSVKHRK